MVSLERLDQLREHGRMRWLDTVHGWRAVPEEVVGALAEDGFEECKREETRSRRGAVTTGGVWQGVNGRTGAVASTVWVRDAVTGEGVVFVDINGEPLRGA
ncbi:MAG TPA: hypothetical protein VNN07_00465 [Candidatus Tectomicrobia bacterium]|nr:hypothetical protein [Candidatus Tectomicrobia bacterium]